jgi:hypothetical protein
LSTIVEVKEQGHVIIYFKIVEEDNKVFVDRPDKPSFQLPSKFDFYERISAAVLKIREERDPPDED